MFFSRRYIPRMAFHPLLKMSWLPMCFPKIGSMLTLIMCHFIATWCLLIIYAEMDPSMCIYSLYQFTGSPDNIEDFYSNLFQSIAKHYVSFYSEKLGSTLNKHISFYNGAGNVVFSSPCLNFICENRAHSKPCTAPK